MNDLNHIKKPSLTPYFQRTKDLAKLFHQLHVRRNCNRKVDAVASLATSLTHPRDDYLTIHIRERRIISPLFDNDSEDVFTWTTHLQEVDKQGQSKLDIEAVDNDWCTPLVQHLMDRREPTDPIKCVEVRHHTPRFTL